MITAEDVMQITTNRRTQGPSKSEASKDDAVESPEVAAVEDISSTDEYRRRIKAGTQAKSDGVDIQHPGLAVVGDSVHHGDSKDHEQGGDQTS